MSEYAGAVAELVQHLGRLPGIGRKSAERLAFHLLRVSEQEALALADSIRRVRQDVRYCASCFNLSESETCEFVPTLTATQHSSVWSNSHEI